MSNTTRALPVSLGELCRYDNGGTPSKSESSYWDGEIPWITSSEISDGTVLQARSRVTTDGIKNSAAKQVPAGTLLLVTRTGVGKVAICTYALAFSQDITAIYPDESKLDKRFLLRFLETQEAYFKRFSRGATIKGITREVLNRLEIPLPSLSEQRRIADILDKADTIRRRRQESKESLASTRIAFFHHLFDDPVANARQWERRPFGDVLESIESGTSPKCLDRSVIAGEWGVLKLGAVTWCEYDPKQNKALPKHLEPDPSIEVKRGDLLFTRKNTYELVAAVAYVFDTPPRLLLPDLVFRLRIKPGFPVLPEYLWGLLSYPSKRRNVQSLAGGAAGSMPNISKAKLLQERVELPPLKLQRAYASILHKTHELSETYESSCKEANDLFSSLCQRAFRGEL